MAMTIIKACPDDPSEVLPAVELTLEVSVVDAADVTDSDALGTIALAG